VEFVSGVARDGAVVDASSPSGYADGKRWLIVPEHNNPTYQWIEETQLMAARGDWRVRFVDYENAPTGREVHTASPYRWWLVLVAWVDHAASGRPMGLAIEHAALFADPLLHLLFLGTAALFVALTLGTFPAALTAVGVATLYPLAATFLPGVANDFGLSQVLAFWSVLLAVAGSLSEKNQRRLFIAAGIAGGCGLWISAALEVPMLLGIAAGGLAAALLTRRAATRGPAPWRAWAFAGAVTSLLAYLVEYFPANMGPQLRVNYPLYGIAWLGVGEILWRVSAWCQGQRPFTKARDIAAWALSLVAAASLPIGISRYGNSSFLAGDLLSNRLTNLPDGIVAGSLHAWAQRDGPTAGLAATCLPVLLLVPAAWLFLRAGTRPAARAALGIALGAVAASLVLAASQLRWWNTLDASLLVLIIASVSSLPRTPDPVSAHWAWGVGLGALALLGVTQLLPREMGSANDIKFTRAEVEGLYERALSQWIADHAGPDGATVLVPPFRTSSFCFYGGLRGLGTQNWENRDGLSATFRIVNSTRPDETLALVNQRGVTHIVVPSWDSDLDDFARLGLKQPLDSFIYALHRTDGGIFSWLRALPYNLPEIAGFSEQSVLVLEVTDETDPATLRSRLVEYLVEMHQIDQASYSSKALLKYPSDLGALVALAQVAKARGDEDGFAAAVKAVVANLATGTERALPFDRRASLAVVLALGGHDDLALAQVNRCLSEIDAAKIRYLTTGSLYHLLVLCRHYNTGISDPNLQALSLKLLPSELRERL